MIKYYIWVFLDFDEELIISTVLELATSGIAKNIFLYDKSLKVIVFLYECRWQSSTLGNHVTLLLAWDLGMQQIKKKEKGLMNTVKTTVKWGTQPQRIRSHDVLWLIDR